MLDGWDVNKRIRIDLPVVTEYISDVPIRIKLTEAPTVERLAFGAEISTGQELKVAFEFGTSSMQCYAENIVHVPSSHANAIYDVRVPFLQPGLVGSIFLYFDSSKPDNTDFVDHTGGAAAKLVWDSQLYHHVFSFGRKANRMRDSVTGLDSLCSFAHQNYYDLWAMGDGYIIDGYGTGDSYTPAIKLVNGFIENQDLGEFGDIKGALTFSGLNINNILISVELFHSQSILFEDLADQTTNYQYLFNAGPLSFIQTDGPEFVSSEELGGTGDLYLRYYTGEATLSPIEYDNIGVDYSSLHSAVLSHMDAVYKSYYGFSGDSYQNEITVNSMIRAVISPIKIGNQGPFGYDPAFNGTLHGVRFLKYRPSAVYAKTVAMCINPSTGPLVYELDSTTGVSGGGSDCDGVTGNMLLPSFGFGGYIVTQSDVVMTSIEPSLGLDTSIEREEITAGKTNSNFILNIAVHGDSAERQVKIDTISFGLGSEVTADPLSMITPDVRFVLSNTVGIEPYSTRIAGVFGFSTLVPSTATKVVKTTSGFGLGNSVAFKGSTVGSFFSSFGLSVETTASMLQAESYQVFMLGCTTDLMPIIPSSKEVNFAIIVSNNIETEHSQLNNSFGLSNSAVIDSIEAVSFNTSFCISSMIDIAWFEAAAKIALGIDSTTNIPLDDFADGKVSFGLLTRMIANSHRVIDNNTEFGIKPILTFGTADNRQAVLLAIGAGVEIQGNDVIDMVDCKYRLSFESLIQKMTDSQCQNTCSLGLNSSVNARDDVHDDDDDPGSSGLYDTKSRWDV